MGNAVASEYLMVNVGWNEDVKQTRRSRGNVLEDRYRSLPVTPTHSLARSGTDLREDKSERWGKSSATKREEVTGGNHAYHSPPDFSLMEALCWEWTAYWSHLMPTNNERIRHYRFYFQHFSISYYFNTKKIPSPLSLFLGSPHQIPTKTKYPPHSFNLKSSKIFLVRNESDIFFVVSNSMTDDNREWITDIGRRYWWW